MSYFLSDVHSFLCVRYLGACCTPAYSPPSLCSIINITSGRWIKFSGASNPCLTTFSHFLHMFSLASLTYWNLCSWCCTTCSEGLPSSSDKFVHFLLLQANVIFLFSSLRQLNFSRFCLPHVSFTCAAGAMYLFSLRAVISSMMY